MTSSTIDGKIQFPINKPLPLKIQFSINDTPEKIQFPISKAHATEHLASLYFDSSHEFNAAVQEKAFAWFQR